jgi:tRNA-specific adenosine deaminase 1
MAADQVASEILNLYSQLPQNGKPSPKQYTVLSGIVAYVPSKAAYLPICLCTGTKCLGNFAPNFEQGITLSDSHAEILARRCLIRYLLLSAIEILKDPNYSLMDDTCPLQLTEDDSREGDKDGEKRFCLKPGWSLWLYISDSPCGDASIYQRSSVDRCFTGKKTRELEHPLPAQTETLGLSSLLRSKPGRVDIDEARRASSMSCSDKICRWSCLGLQG